MEEDTDTASLSYSGRLPQSQRARMAKAQSPLVFSLDTVTVRSVMQYVAC